MRTLIAVAVLAAAVSVPSATQARIALRPCTAGDLYSLGGMLQGATGSMLGGVQFRNISATRCLLGGRPDARIFTRAGRLLRTRERRFTLDPSFTRINSLSPGKRAVLYIQWSNWCGRWPGDPIHTLVLRLRLTTGTRVAGTFRSGRPRCDTHAGSTLARSRWVAWH